MSKAEIRACGPWLFAELSVVKPEIVLCLGATAAQTLIAPDFLVSRRRGEHIASSLAPHVLATVHPASLLRGPPEQRDAEIARFIADLKKAGRLLRER